MNYDDKILVFELSDTPDNQGHVFPVDTVVDHPDEVFLTNEFKKDIKSVVGKVRLFKEDNCFYITDFLIFDTKIVDCIEDFTPAICGRVVEIDEKKRLVKSCSFQSIGLCLRPNSNPNIKTIKEQLKNS